MAKTQGQSTYLIIGAGKFGQGVARALAERGARVIAVDRHPEALAQLCTVASNTLQFDATDEAALTEAARGTDVAIVSIGEDVESSLLIVAALKEAGVPTVVAKALTDTHGKLLARVGADRIVFPERDMGRKLAASLVSPMIFDQVEVTPGYAILEVTASGALCGKSLAQSDIRAQYGVTIIAIKPGGGARREAVVAPPADTVIAEGDILVVIGTDADIERFRRVTA
ncbi:MAG: TrkA family potassium uptake protein [Verrucomicrobia bacterium]|nr:TrkA family potassium uptake protein [Verrucomicrobiota bacterium]